MHAIFMAFDDNHFHYAKSCINSIKANYPEHPIILISYSGNNENVLFFIKEKTNTKLIYVKHDYHYNLGSMPSNIVYKRFNLWTDQFDEYENILHLDADTIVLKPLDALFKKNEFFICSDHSKTANIFDSPTIHTKNLLKADGICIDNIIDEMGNAGIYLIPKKYRTEKYYQDLIRLAEKYHHHVSYGDQSIISLWAHLQKIAITDEYEYNCQIRFLYDKSITLKVENLTIIHFSGEAKDIEKYNRPDNADEIIEFYLITNAIRFFYRKERKAFEHGEDIQMLKSKYITFMNKEPE